MGSKVIQVRLDYNNFLIEQITQKPNILIQASPSLYTYACIHERTQVRKEKERVFQFVQHELKDRSI